MLLGNYASGRRRELLVEAWGEAGIDCVTVGAHGVAMPDPLSEIAKADIVVGKSRAILDAMACGRAAYVLDFAGGDGWVTKERYAAMEADNFAGQATDWVLDRDRLVADLADYDRDMGQVNRELVLAHHDARTHAYELVELFRSVNPRAEPATGPLRELARLVRLQWATEQDAMVLRQALTERAVVAENYARSLEEDRERLQAQIAELEQAADRQADCGTPPAVAVNGLVASERAPGLFVAPGIEIPDDAVLGANVVIYPGVVIGAGCVLQDGAVLGKRLVLGRHTTTPAASTGEATTVLEPGAQVGCHAVIVAGASLGPGAVVGDHSLIRERARLDAASMIGHGGVIGRDCRIGARSKLMAGAILGHDMVFEEDVFCGPGLSVTDDPTMGRHHGVELPFVRLRRAAGSVRT